MHEQIETFFTLWHGVLYSGFVVTALVLVIGVWRNRAQSTSWQAAIPTGYSLSLVGAALFMFGGMADGVWHTLLGIEVDVEALLSPPHLLLAFGGALIVTGPLRAAWVRNENTPTLAQLLPAILSATLLLSLMAFFIQYASVLALATDLQRAIPGDLGEAIRSKDIAGVLVQTAVLMGLMLALARRWRMPCSSCLVVGQSLRVLTVSSKEAADALPTPLLSIRVMPDVAEQGDVLIVRVATQDAISVEGVFAEHRINFASDSDGKLGHFIGLIGVDGLIQPGKYNAPNK